MTPEQEQKLFQTHSKALSGHYGDTLKSMKFNAPRIYEKDSVVSVSASKKEAYVTRHHVAGHYMSDAPTHSIVFNGEWFSRL